jgi:serine/threonine protein phosphatase PrpC
MLGSKKRTKKGDEQKRQENDQRMVFGQYRSKPKMSEAPEALSAVASLSSLLSRSDLRDAPLSIGADTSMGVLAHGYGPSADAAANLMVNELPTVMALVPNVLPPERWETERKALGDAWNATLEPFHSRMCALNATTTSSAILSASGQQSTATKSGVSCGVLVAIPDTWEVYASYIGRVRIVHCRNGRVQWASQDHIMANEDESSRFTTSERAAFDGSRSALTRMIGGEDGCKAGHRIKIKRAGESDEEPEVLEKTNPVLHTSALVGPIQLMGPSAGDAVIMVGESVTRVLSDRRIAKIVQRGMAAKDGPNLLAKRIVRSAQREHQARGQYLEAPRSAMVLLPQDVPLSEELASVLVKTDDGGYRFPTDPLQGAPTGSFSPVSLRLTSATAPLSASSAPAPLPTVLERLPSSVNVKVSRRVYNHMMRVAPDLERSSFKGDAVLQNKCWVRLEGTRQQHQLLQVLQADASVRTSYERVLTYSTSTARKQDLHAINARLEVLVKHGIDTTLSLEMSNGELLVHLLVDSTFADWSRTVLLAR